MRNAYPKKERERERLVSRQMGDKRARGGHPPRSMSSDEGEKEMEMTLPL
jgi:hypothetical protein